MPGVSSANYRKRLCRHSEFVFILIPIFANLDGIRMPGCFLQLSFEYKRKCKIGLKCRIMGMRKHRKEIVDK